MSAKIALALHEIMAEVGYVQKTGKNAFHGYKYAGEADLLAALRPAMVKAGLILLPSVKSVSPTDEHGNVTVHMEYSLIHKDGDIWPAPLGAVGMGNDRAKNGTVGDKGVYKAITGANKYFLFKLFQIETGDDDPEAASEHDKSSDSAPPPKAMAKPISSAEQKRGLEAIDADLLDCHSVMDVNKCVKIWAAIMDRDGWSKDFREVAIPKFGKRRDTLAETPVEDIFPGDIPTRRELAQHPLNGG